MRVFIAFLMLIAGLGAHGQAVSRTELRGTNNLIRSQHVRTVATIADLIALGLATNEVEVTSHHSTNGLGGGRFRLGGTNGFATNYHSIFASTAPRKFWFRKDATPMNPEWFGAVHDGGTDDQLPLQAFFNAHTNGYAVSQMPPGIYRHTGTLALTNHQPGTSFRIVGAGAGRGPDGTRFLFAGSLGQTQMMIVGANNSSLENLAIDCASIAYVGLHLDSENVEKPGSPGSSGVKLKNVLVAAQVGAGSKGISVGHNTGGATPQVSEITMEDVSFQGTTGSDHGFKNNIGGNTKDFTFRRILITGLTNGIHITGGANNVVIDGIGGGACQTNFNIYGSDVVLMNFYDESSSYLGKFKSEGANAASLFMLNVNWIGSAVAGGNDEIMELSGSCTLQNNWFFNNRTASSLPLISVALVGSGISSVDSEGNFYNRATVPPIYASLDTSNTNYWVFNREGAAIFAHTNRPFTSKHDFGGVAGVLIQFEDYDVTGGDNVLRYLEILGNTMLAYSNGVSIGTNGRAGVLNVQGRRFWNGGSSNASPVSFLARLSTGEEVETAVPGGTGDFVGPSSATDNAIVRFDGTTGKLGQNSGVIISDTTNVTGVQSLTANSVVSAASIRVGVNSSTLGGINLPNSVAIYGRNQANNNEYALLYLDGNDIIRLGRSVQADVNFTVAGYSYDMTLRGVNSKTIIEAADAVDIARFGFSSYGIEFPQMGEGVTYVDAAGNFLPLTIGAGLNYAAGELSATATGGGSSITPFYRPNWTSIFTNFAIGSDTNIWIDMDRSYILSVTNVCNGCKVHVVLTNSGSYNYSWFNTTGTTNRIEWQNEAAPVSTSPATDAGLYSVYLQGTATNVMGWYYPPRGTANIVAKTVTTSGGITSGGPIQAGGTAASIEWTNSGTGFTHSQLYSNITAMRIDIYDMSTLWPVVVGTAYCWSPKGTNGVGNVLWTNGPCGSASSVTDVLTNNTPSSKTWTNAGVYMAVAGTTTTNIDFAVRDVFTNQIVAGVDSVGILFSNLTANRSAQIWFINDNVATNTSITLPATVIGMSQTFLAWSNSITGIGVHTMNGKTNAYILSWQPPRTTNNFVSGQLYTNLGGCFATIEASIGLTNALSTDVARMSLWLDEDGDGTFEYKGKQVRLNGLIALAGVGNLFASDLPPGARFTFTNDSGVATVVDNSSRWRRR